MPAEIDAVEVAPVVAPPPPPQADVPMDDNSRRARALALIQTKREAEPVVQTEVAPEKEAEAKTEEAKPEVVVEEAKVEPPKEDKLSLKAKEIKEREASLQKRVSDLEAQKAEVEKKAKELEAKESALKMLKKSPTKALAEAGITFQELADAIIAENDIPEPLRAKLAELEGTMTSIKEREEKLAKEKADQEAKSQADYIEQTTANYKKHIKTVIEAKQDTFELVHSAEAYDMVFDVIQAYFDKNDQLPSIEDAAKAVEDFLEKKWKKLATAKKFQAAKKEEPSAKTPATLTNSMSSGVSRNDDNGEPLSEEQRFKRALSVMKFNK